MPLFGLFKTPEERKAESVYRLVFELSTRMGTGIALVNSQFSPEQRNLAARTALNTVMCSNLHETTVAHLRNQVKRSMEAPGSEAVQMGLSIALFYIQAWAELKTLRESSRGMFFLLFAQMEGSLVGFIERSGLPIWETGSNADVSDFEAARRRFLAIHTQLF